MALWYSDCTILKLLRTGTLGHHAIAGGSAARVTAFAVHVWCLFHGFTLRATVFLSIVNGATAIWMRALFVICHFVALFRFGEPLRQHAVTGRRPNRKNHYLRAGSDGISGDSGKCRAN
jgi:hypothetical protein